MWQYVVRPGRTYLYHAIWYFVPRARAHFHVRVVHGEHGIGCSGRDGATRQGRRPAGDDTGYRASRPEDGHAVTLELLIEQRRRCAASPSHAAQQQEAVGQDVAHDIPDFVEGTGAESLRGAPTQRERQVARLITGAAGEERPERVHHRLLETGDGGHGGETDREAIDVALGGQADCGTEGKNECQDHGRRSHAQAWARHGTVQKHTRE